MDIPPSGRSPSPAHPYGSHLNPRPLPSSHSPSPQPHLQSQAQAPHAQDPTFASLDPSLLDNQFLTGDDFTADFSQSGSDYGFNQQDQYFTVAPPALESHDSNHSLHLSPGHSPANQNGYQFTNTLSLQQDGQVQFPDFDITSDPSLDPSLFYGNQQSQTSQPTLLDPNALSLDHMATTLQNPAPTPPHLLNTNTVMSSRSTSPRHTPSPQQAHPVRPNRSRNTSESLDPSSAAYPHGYPGGAGDWGTGVAFRGHRRKPSDAISDISSHSNQASPYIGHMDSFDQNAHVSPMLGAQNDVPFINDTFGLTRFTLSDSNMGSHDHLSPVPSLQNSPRIPMDQQPLPAFTANDNFGLSPDMAYQQSANGNFNAFQGMQMFDQNSFRTIDITKTASHEGMADAMSPPEINIDFAPPSRQPSFGPRSRAASANALIPPDAMRRKRAKSDPYSGSRSPSPGITARGRSPSLQPGLQASESLSPSAPHVPGSRSPSPNGRNRSVSAASDSRQYLLDLADPERAASGAGGDQKRQKHPANFHCNLCDKKFTRAYNLRSHLRTHTDERPFVCTVCNKAFARQHDRKRHEGLHSGEKKFVCKGALKTGASWGCSRRFARADALGRHFRSEAGRECIKPLLDEEAEERRTAWLEEQRQHQMQSQQGFVAPGPMTDMPQPGPQLPAVLLQMYPDLAGFNFGSAPLGAGDDLDDEYGGRSSFDASSGNEFEMSDNDMNAYEQMQMDQQQQQQQGYSGMAQNWP
ncbi:hypothetical protein ANO11243_009460 [Dothideomycetidae sp. 11243]|nr:hypothetical protein ANO11243_009460 [fungal sp. No.11243]